MDSGTALSGGIFGSAVTGDGDGGALRELVVDLGRRAFNARSGRRSLPDEFDDDLWRDLEQTGLARLTDAEEDGAGPAQVATVLRCLARYAAAVPLAETDLLGAWLGRQAGLDVPDRGPLTVAVADARYDGGRVCGSVTDIPWPTAADRLYLLARTPDATLVTATGGVDIVVGHNVGGEPRGSLEFALPATQFAEVDAAVGEELVVRGAWARCMQTMGAFDGAAELTATHVGQRVQFGRRLIDFQSVQHAVATMAEMIEQARAAATLAVAATSDHGFNTAAARYATTGAKVTIGRAVTPVAAIAHQFHGAIGVTMEHPLRLFTMRATCWMDEFGDTDSYARRLGRIGDADPWDILIGNDLRGW